MDGARDSTGRGFESLGEILSGSRASGDSPSSSRGQSQGPVETRAELVTCQSCRGQFQAEVKVFRLFRREHVFTPQRCPACQEREKARDARREAERVALARVATRERWRRTCGIPEYLQLKTFDTFERELQPQAFDAALSWAEGFWLEGPKGYPSLLLYSAAPGCGKTHLLVAIANRIFRDWEGEPERATCPVRFESGPGLVRRIRATYNLAPGVEGHEREEDVYHELRGVRVLMLDDVGKEKPSDHTREVYWYIIDERVKGGLPVVISSRLPLEGRVSLEQVMGEDTVDRLVGMTRGKIVKLGGSSYRRLRHIP